MYTHKNKKINPKFPLDIFTGSIKEIEESDGKKSKDKKELKEDTKFTLSYNTEDAKNIFIDTFAFSKEEIEREYGRISVRSCIELVLDNPSVPLFELEIYEVAIEHKPKMEHEEDVKKQYVISQLQQKKDNKPSLYTQYFLDKDKAIDFSTEYIKNVDERIRYSLSISKVPLYGINSSVFKTDE